MMKIGTYGMVIGTAKDEDWYVVFRAMGLSCVRSWLRSYRALKKTVEVLVLWAWLCQSSRLEV